MKTASFAKAIRYRQLARDVLDDAAREELLRLAADSERDKTMAVIEAAYPSKP